MSPQLDQDLSQFLEDFQGPENYKSDDVKSRLLDLQITAHAHGDALPTALFTFIQVCDHREFIPWPIMEHCMERMFDQAYAESVPA